MVHWSLVVGGFFAGAMLGMLVAALVVAQKGRDNEDR